MRTSSAKARRDAHLQDLSTGSSEKVWPPSRMTLSRDTGLRVKLRRGALGGVANQNATLSVVSFGAGDPARFDRPVCVENLIGGRRLRDQISQKVIAPASDVVF